MGTPSKISRKRNLGRGWGGVGNGIRVESANHMTGAQALNRLLVDSDPEGATLVLQWLQVPAVFVGAACAITAAVQYSGQKAVSLPEVGVLHLKRMSCEAVRAMK